MRRKGSFSVLVSSASGGGMVTPRGYHVSSSGTTTESDVSSLDRAVAAVLNPSSSSSRLALPRHSTLQSTTNDTMQGFMVIHAKKPKRKKLFTLNRSYFVVADAARSVLEVFTSETRSECVYVFSLAGANVDFETDDVSHAVRAKCFCLNVQSWRKRGVDYLRPQGFVFYQENQAEMMIWVKCIHVAIRKVNAATKTSQSTRLSDASTVGGDESDVTESERVGGDVDTEHDESERDSVVSPPQDEASSFVDMTTKTPMVVALPAAPKSPRRQRSQIRRRAGADSAATGPTASSPTISPSARPKPPPFSRLNTMLATMKHHSTSDNEKFDSTQPPTEASSSNRLKVGPSFSPPSLMSSLHMARGKSSLTRHVAGISSPSGKRLSDPFQFRKKDDTLFSGFSPFFSPRGCRNTPNPLANKPPTRESERIPSTAESDVVTPLGDNPTCSPSPEKRSVERGFSAHLIRIAFLLVTCLGGILQLSIFLPFATAGFFVYFSEQHADDFVSAAFAGCWVYMASCVQASLGMCSIVAIVYGWFYADFRTMLWQRRRRLAETLAEEEKQNFAHIQFPTWAVQPDVDRVVWLNKVLSTSWPYMKIAIRNSIMDNLNPVLESSRPAFMSSLSLVRLDLGTRPPVITGVKFISATTKTEEVTLDVDVRLMSDESLVAELRMVSSLGAAAVVTLRDVLLAGTLRVTLSPLATYWPCFSAVRLCFTERPLVDFSLTAAKINLSNVPFASEWLQTFLHDLLLDYFVFPKVLHVPLWDEESVATS